MKILQAIHKTQTYTAGTKDKPEKIPLELDVVGFLGTDSAFKCVCVTPEGAIKLYSATDLVVADAPMYKGKKKK